MAVFSVLLLTANPPGINVEKPKLTDPPPSFIKLDAREVLLRSVEIFLNRDNIKQIQLCFLPEHADEGRRKFGGHLGFSGVKVLQGGPRWIDQIASAAGKINPDCTHVIIHDAARPAVAYSDLEALMQAAEKSAAVTLAALLRAPLVEVDEGGNPVGIRAAADFMHLLTPQAFTKAKFEEMAAKKEELHPSQFSLLKALPLNARVNSPADVSYVKAMLNLLPKPKVKAPTSPFEEAQW